ncbi:MAG TPA: hypothetical protein VFV75_07360 [Candidatus Polarisedimenticolaceae bacterium]|nr:hypothetical protein [Candidatus Polarisedimenticolaceae bacterium]
MRRAGLDCRDPRFVGVALVAAVVIAGAAWLGRELPPGSPARLGLAVVQAMATTLVIVLTVWGMRGLDELQRRIHLEALAGAFAGTAILVSGWGFLEIAGAPAVRWGLWIWPIMSVLWATGLIVARRRYR